MKTIELIQQGALVRLGEALADLEKSTDPFEIEAKINFIRVIATASYRHAHMLNSQLGEWHDPDCFAMTQGEVKP